MRILFVIIRTIKLKKLYFAKALRQLFPQNFSEVELGELLPDEVACKDKLLLDDLGRADGLRGVFDADVQPMTHLSREGGATLVGVVAHGYDIVPRVVQVGGYMGRSVVAYVDTGFGHDLDGQGVNLLGRIGPGREHL